MKRIFFTTLLLFTFAQAQTKVYDESIDAMKQIREATELAQKTGRYVLCQVGGDWCPWCVRFAQFAKNDSVVAPLIEENYVYIHVNYSKGNKNLEAMRSSAIPVASDTPSSWYLTAKGNLSIFKNLNPWRKTKATVASAWRSSFASGTVRLSRQK